MDAKLAKKLLTHFAESCSADSIRAVVGFLITTAAKRYAKEAEAHRLKLYQYPEGSKLRESATEAYKAATLNWWALREMETHLKDCRIRPNAEQRKALPGMVSRAA